MLSAIFDLHVFKRMDVQCNLQPMVQGTNAHRQGSSTQQYNDADKEWGFSQALKNQII